MELIKYVISIIRVAIIADVNIKKRWGSRYCVKSPLTPQKNLINSHGVLVNLNGSDFDSLIVLNIIQSM